MKTTTKTTTKAWKDYLPKGMLTHPKAHEAEKPKDYLKVWTEPQPLKTPKMLRSRTGLRTPKNFLKVWGDHDRARRLTPRLRVGIVDEELPLGREGGRKSWYLAVTQDEDLFETLGPVHGAPADGKTLLLFEDDVVALVNHLMGDFLVPDTDALDPLVLNGPAHRWERDIPAEIRAMRARKRPRRKAKR